MKIKGGFLLREILDLWIVVPIGERVVDFSGLLSLSESGAILWKKLEQGAEMKDLLEALLSEFDIDEETARNDINDFILAVQAKGLIES